VNVEDAIWTAVHECPGGPKGLAARMEIGHSTLQNMADPRQDSHGWSLKRFRQLLAFSGNRLPLMSLCEENGGVFVPLLSGTTAGAKGLLRKMQTLAAEFGDVPREIEKSVKDGRISASELRRIELQLDEMVAAACSLRAQVRDVHESGTRLSEDERP